METKILEFMEKMYLEMQTGFSNINKEITGMKSEIASMKSDILRLENKIDTLQSQFNEHEVKDANRHLELTEAIIELKNDITTLEDVSGKNLRDIALLKKAK